uniref:Prostaglandin E synthase 3 n=1 Tax=Eptatretus burgeri TaxID=7764 RepID=A0A8C4X1B1_EPTBU
MAGIVGDMTRRYPATTKWYDRRQIVLVEFCIEDSKDVHVSFEEQKLIFRCHGGADDHSFFNEISLFDKIDPKESNYHRTDRSVHCVMRKGSAGMVWPRLTKDKSKFLWLSVDFTNWRDWEDASDNEFSNYDEFSSMMNKMGCDEELPELDGSEEESSGSDSEKLPDLE